MVLITDEEFFRVTPRELWGDLAPSVLPVAVLDEELQRVAATMWLLYPSKKKRSGLKKIAVIAAVVVAAAAVASLAAAGTATASAASTAAASTGAATTAAGSAATAAAGASSAATAAAGAATTAGASGVTVAQAYGYIQTAAKTIGPVASVTRALKGDAAPSDLERAAGAIAKSPDFTEAALQLAISEIEAETTQKLTEEQRAMLAERIRREQEAYAAELAAKAERMRAGEAADAELRAAVGMLSWLLPVGVAVAAFALRG